MSFDSKISSDKVYSSPVLISDSKKKKKHDEWENREVIQLDIEHSNRLMPYLNLPKLSSVKDAFKSSKVNSEAVKKPGRRDLEGHSSKKISWEKTVVNEKDEILQDKNPRKEVKQSNGWYLGNLPSDLVTNDPLISPTDRAGKCNKNQSKAPSQEEIFFLPVVNVSITNEGSSTSARSPRIDNNHFNILSECRLIRDQLHRLEDYVAHFSLQTSGYEDLDPSVTKHFKKVCTTISNAHDYLESKLNEALGKNAPVYLSYTNIISVSLLSFFETAQNFYTNIKNFSEKLINQEIDLVFSIKEAEIKIKYGENHTSEKEKTIVIQEISTYLEDDKIIIDFFNSLDSQEKNKLNYATAFTIFREHLVARKLLATACSGLHDIVCKESDKSNRNYSEQSAFATTSMFNYEMYKPILKRIIKAYTGIINIRKLHNLAFNLEKKQLDDFQSILDVVQNRCRREIE